MWISVSRGGLNNIWIVRIIKLCLSTHFHPNGQGVRSAVVVGLNTGHHAMQRRGHSGSLSGTVRGTRLSPGGSLGGKGGSPDSGAVSKKQARRGDYSWLAPMDRDDGTDLKLQRR